MNLRKLGCTLLIIPTLSSLLLEPVNAQSSGDIVIIGDTAKKQAELQQNWNVRNSNVNNQNLEAKPPVLAPNINARNERFLMLGTNKDGEPLMLDTQSIKGTRFKLVRPYGYGIAEISFKASCAESRLFITNVAVINSQGRTVMEDKKSEETPFISNSATGEAMTLVCRKVRARGW